MSSGLTRDDTNLPPPGFGARATQGDPATGMTQSAPRYRPLPIPVAADESLTSRSLSFTFCDTGVRLPDGCDGGSAGADPAGDRCDHQHSDDVDTRRAQRPARRGGGGAGGQDVVD